MLLLLALFALAVPATHGCTVSIEVVKTDDTSTPLTAESDVLVDQEVDITCEFNGDDGTACETPKYQIGDEAATAYSDKVSYNLTDVLTIKFTCTATNAAADADDELVLTIKCKDPGQDAITAALSYDASAEKIKLECDATSTCANSEVGGAAGTVTAEGSDDILVEKETGDRFKITYIATEAAALVDAGYTGTCTYGTDEKTVKFCPETPAISLTDAADNVITPTANGDAFTVKCDFQACTLKTFMVNDVDKTDDLTSANVYVQNSGVLTATEYKCMNGDDKIATTKVKCMDGMEVLTSVGGVCKTTLKPMICNKLDNGTYVPSCEEDASNDKSQCRCPASTPYYHIADGKCQEKCGARGIFVSMFLVLAAFIRFL